MELIRKEIIGHRIVPVIKLDRVDDAIPLAEALIEGGLPIAEITFRTSAAEQSIANVSKAFPKMIVGAGTITTVTQAEQAFAAGAKFIVTPGFSRNVTEFCLDKNLPIFPGVCTPSEIMWLLEYRLTVAKFFPATQFGGLDTIKSLSAPFPQMYFMPTGGISDKNILEYLAFGKVIACGGSWMVKDSLIKSGSFDEIKSLVIDAVKLVKS